MDPLPYDFKGKSAVDKNKPKNCLGRSIQNVIHLQSGNCKPEIVLFLMRDFKETNQSVVPLTGQGGMKEKQSL